MTRPRAIGLPGPSTVTQAAALAAALWLCGCASGKSVRLGETAELYSGAAQVPAQAIALVGPITDPAVPAAESAAVPSDELARTFVLGGVSGPTMFVVVDERGVVDFRRVILLSPGADGLALVGDYMIDPSVDDYAELRQVIDDGRWISDLRAKPDDLKPKATAKKKRGRRS